MGEFKKIETQEEFDAAIKDRLAREKEKYADYDSLKKENESFKTQIADLEKAKKDLETEKGTFSSQIDALNSKIKGYETDSAKTRIALEKGLPYEFAKRLSGETEEEIAKDAEEMAKYVTKQQPPAPTGSNEPQVYGEDKNLNKAYAELAKSISESLGGKN